MKILPTLRNYKVVTLIYYLALLTPLQLLAQEITGKITNKADGSPLANVTVSNKTTATNSKSNADGSFKIKAEKGNKLTFALLGFTNQEYTVQNQAKINIQLESSVESLDEVVVTALGIKREVKGLTYATQQVKASEVADIKDNSGNFLSNLTGKVAGAVVSTTSGGPGSSAKVVLRGNKSITGDNNALIVIDGIVFDNSTVTQPTAPNSNAYSSSDAGANINPEDIESINVLKGPSAAALYGSRAVNGAIIITTKQGAAGSLKLDLSTTQSLESPTNLPSFQNSYGQGNGAVAGTNTNDSWGPKIQNATDNISGFFRNGYSNSQTLSASGGTEKITSLFSFTNSKIQGIVPKNQMDRNNLDLRVNTEFIKGLKTDVKLSYVNQDIKNKTRLATDGLTNILYTSPRDLSSESFNLFETINPGTGLPQNNFWNPTNGTTNHPLWTINRTSVNEKRDRVYGMGSLSYQFFPWMNVMTRFSFDSYNEETKGSFYDGTRPGATFLAGGTYYVTPSKYSNTNLDILITGGTDIIPNKIKLNYVVGSSFLTRSFSTHTNMANGLIIPNNFSLAFASTPSFSYNGLIPNSPPYDYKRHLNSVFASANLEFWNNLYLDITARNDWSSTLPAPHSYFYPSVGLSYVLNNALNLPEWINFAKVRGSYTQVGNDAAPNLLSQTFNYSQGTGVGFILRNHIKNLSNLKPEKTNSYEAGFDLQLFSSRLNLSGTYYHSNSINQLMNVSTSTSTGYQMQYINAGDIENKGFELQVQAKPIQTSTFTWETGINFARNINKVVELTDKIQSVAITASTIAAQAVAEVGGSYGDLKGLAWKKDPTTGKYIVNANGLPVTETNVTIGNPNPKANLGWINSFKYKNLGFHINIDGRFGGEMISGTAAYLADYGVAQFTETHRDGNWIIDAVDAAGNQNTKAINAETFWSTVGGNGTAPYGQFFTFDMTNIRVRNLGLSYNAPRNILPYIKSAQVSFSVNNAFFLYKGKSVIDIPGLGKIKNPVDPESTIGSGNYQGIEAGGLPISRTFTLGLRLSF